MDFRRNSGRRVAARIAAALAIALGSAAGSRTVPSNAAPPNVVRFALAADPATLDPLLAHADAAAVELQIARLQFEPFVDLDARGNMVPVLLARVPTVPNGGLSRDGRTIVYHLRPGVRWSDGVPVTSRDVLFTLKAILDPRNPVASREGYDLIESATALDARTVRIRLRRAWSPAVATFFSYGTAPQFVLPEHVLAHEMPLGTAAFGSAPAIGDGPFVFASWKRGDRLVYRANGRYWRGRPAIDRIEMPIVPDAGTNFALLESGNVDFNLLAPVQARTLGKRLPIASVPTALVAGIAFNTARPPLDDPRVRRAIAQSIDRQAIGAKLTLGAYPVADSDRPRFSWAYDPRIRQPGFDPAAADAAFDAAGWHRGAGGVRSKGGRVLALTYVQFPESTTGTRVAAFVQEALRGRGVALTVKSVAMAQLFLPKTDGGLLAAGKFDLAYVPWQMGADPDDRFLYGCNAANQNYMRWCDPRVQADEVRAVSEPDRDRRRDLYRRIDATVARDVPVLWLFNPTYLYAYRPELCGFAPNAFVPTWNAYAWRLCPS